MVGNQKIIAEATALTQSALITLYILDGSRQGADTYYYYPGTDPNGGDIVFQGLTYRQYPVDAKGFEMRSSGTYPTPQISFSNVYGYMSALVLAYNDLLGCRVIRRRTFAKFLDGAPEADPTAQFPDDVYYINQKTEENSSVCTFQLSSPMDVEDVSLPKRQIIGNLCQWVYRSAECSFSTSVAVAEIDDTPINATQNFIGAWSSIQNYAIGDVVYVTGYRGLRRYFRAAAAIDATVLAVKPPNPAYWTEDACSKRIQGCQLRFGRAFARNYGLPFGGFPAVERLPL